MMIEITDGEIEAAIQELEACTTGDIEVDHGNADDVLCRLLDRLGLRRVVEAWERVERWYA